MTKTYSITDAKFAAAKDMISRKGGTVRSDNSFAIMGAEGSFQKNGDSLTVNITKKPFFASWKNVESVLEEFFG